MATFLIKQHSDTVVVQGYLLKHMQQAIEQGKPLVVRIDQKQEQRTLAQNRLIHMWFSEIAKHTGESDERIKFALKRKFLAGIYVRDSEDARASYNALQDYKGIVSKLDGDEGKQRMIHYKRLVNLFISDHVSTRKATTKQLSEFCDKIQLFASRDLGLKLTIPDDLKYLIS